MAEYAPVSRRPIAAVCFWQASRQPVLLLLAPLFCYVRLWCNMLDEEPAAARPAGAHAESCQLRQRPGNPSDQRRSLGHGMAPPEIARDACARSRLVEGAR